jgi:hypothetical protein
MRHLLVWLSLAIATTAPALSCLNLAKADQNPAPANVGLYNYSTFTVSTSTASNILPRNVYRAGLIVQNNGGVSVVIKPGSVPANATDGIVIPAGTVMQFNPPFVDAIFGQSASSTAKIVMIENSK